MTRNPLTLGTACRLGRGDNLAGVEPFGRRCEEGRCARGDRVLRPREHDRGGRKGDDGAAEPVAHAVADHHGQLTERNPVDQLMQADRRAATADCHGQRRPSPLSSTAPADSSESARRIASCRRRAVCRSMELETSGRLRLISAIRRRTLAGGFEIALACDLITAGAGARFGIPEVKRGLVAPAGA